MALAADTCIRATILQMLSGTEGGADLILVQVLHGSDCREARRACGRLKCAGTAHEQCAAPDRLLAGHLLRLEGACLQISSA